MTNKGGNRDRDNSRRDVDAERKNAKDEAVARDPDIAGVLRRESNDMHARGRQEQGPVR